MITSEIKQFIEGPQGISMGTRDSNMVPEYTRVLGAWITDSGTLKVQIAKINSDMALSNLDDNGQIAITLANPPSYECYQAKGKSIDYSDSMEEDQEKLKHYLEIFDKEVQSVGVPAGAIYSWPNSPSVVIEIEVQEIFDQTPKIGAGNSISQA